MLACPVTTQEKGYPFEVAVPHGLSIAGVILADQIKSLDGRTRNATHICSLPGSVLDELLAKASALLAPE